MWRTHLEELRRCMPHLPSQPTGPFRSGRRSISVIPLRYSFLKSRRVPKLAKVVSLLLGRGEDSRVPTEIAVVRVVERVVDKVSDEHLYAGRGLSVSREVVRCDAAVVDVLVVSTASAASYTLPSEQT